MKRFTTRLPAELLEALHAKATVTKTSMAEVLRAALEVALKVTEETRTFVIDHSSWSGPKVIGIPVSWLKQAQEMACRGEFIYAIKYLRDQYQNANGTILGLYEAKTIVETIRAEGFKDRVANCPGGTRTFTIQVGGEIATATIPQVWVAEAREALCHRDYLLAITDLRTKARDAGSPLGLVEAKKIVDILGVEIRG